MILYKLHFFLCEFSVKRRYANGRHTSKKKVIFIKKSYFDAIGSLQKSLLLHPLHFFLFVTYISSMALIRYHRVILFLVEVC